VALVRTDVSEELGVSIILRNVGSYKSNMAREANLMAKRLYSVSVRKNRRFLNSAGMLYTVCRVAVGLMALPK
jgi:hypothetical protein